MICDVAIVGGVIIDGTGARSQTANVGVKDGIIVTTTSSVPAAHKILDATECVVTPGFIDGHSNLSWGMFCEQTIGPALYQGITTAVTGNCGSSLFPALGAARDWLRTAAWQYGQNVTWTGLADFADAVPPIAIDVVPLVGHGTLRAASVGFVDRGATAGEREHLRRLVAETLADGAWGISFGLAYPPGCFADREELIACCKEAGNAGKVCCFHLRIESDHLVEAVEEVVELCRESRARCVICHHKALGRKNWGKTRMTLRIIDGAVANRHTLYSDVYPYTSALRNLAMLLPDWAHEGGREKLVQRLRDPSLRSQLIGDIRKNVDRWDARWEDTVVLKAPATPTAEGARMSQLLGRMGDEYMLSLLEQNEGQVLTTYDGISPEDMQRVCAHPCTFLGTDGNAQHSNDVGHARSFVATARFISVTALRSKTLSIEKAIHKMTGLPARVFELPDRGIIAENYKADMVVFPLARADVLSDLDCLPTAPLSRHMLVSGHVVIEDGVFTGKLPGRVVRHPRSLAS